MELATEYIFQNLIKNLKTLEFLKVNISIDKRLDLENLIKLEKIKQITLFCDVFCTKNIIKLIKI